MKSHRSDFGGLLVILLAAVFLLLAAYIQAMSIRSEADKRELRRQHLRALWKQPPGSSVQPTGRAADHHG
jgi:hypothetical protein